MCSLLGYLVFVFTETVLLTFIFAEGLTLEESLPVKQSSKPEDSAVCPVVKQTRRRAGMLLVGKFSFFLSFFPYNDCQDLIFYRHVNHRLHSD